MPKWPNSAVAARNDRSCVRPVVWACGGPTCAPISSGGSSSAGPALDAAGARARRWCRCAQTRSVRARMPRSTRAPPDEQDSISTPGWRGAQLVEQPVDGERLRVHRRPPVVAGLDEVAVVVPLEVVDVVLGEQRVEPLEEVGVGLRVREVEHLLVAPRRRQPARRAEDPVGVGAGQVGVGVDHLGLDPEPELHAAARGRGRPAGAGRPARRPRRRTSRRGRRCRRGGPRNQPSSSTNRSTPTSAAASASAVSRSRSWSK